MSTFSIIRSVGKYNPFRSFSTNADFPQLRSVYHDQVGVLRKQWKLEHEAKLEVKRLADIEEDRKRTLVKAIKLRRIRAESVIRKEAARIQNEAVRLRVREQRARALLLHQAKVAKQQRRYAGAIAELETEKEHWLTRENLDTRITEDLFKNPATTGLTSRYSNYWRYSAYAPDLNRSMKNDEDRDDGYDHFYEDEIQLAGERDMGKRIEMIDFLDQSVATGVERANFKSLVDEFLDTFRDLDAPNVYPESSEIDNDYEEEREDFRPFSVYQHPDGEVDENYDFDKLFKDEPFVDDSIDLNEPDDPGDYKKKQVDAKKKVAGQGRKKKK